MFITGVATMGPRGAMAPSLLSYFSIVSMSWFTFTILSILAMLWPPHLFSASNAPVVHTCRYRECSKGAHQAHEGLGERQRYDMVPRAS